MKTQKWIIGELRLRRTGFNVSLKPEGLSAAEVPRSTNNYRCGKVISTNTRR